MKYTRAEKAVLLLFPVLIAVAMFFQLTNPQSYLATSFTGAAIPAAALGFCLTDSAFRTRRRRPLERGEDKELKEAELDLLRRKLAETKGKPPLVLPWSQSYRPHECLGNWYANDSFCPVHGMKSPEKQLEQLSAQYGLPVTTPLQKPEPLPLVIVPPVSAAYAGAKELEASLEAPMAYLTGDTGQAYVPAGQAELNSDLLEMLREQVAARGGPARGYYPRCRWFMSAEWLAEVKQLKIDSTLAWQPRERVSRSKFSGQLYGYPVIVGDAFGVPELREP